jgi:hypothetical protein
MAFCSKCGAQLEGDERFCAKCGNDVTAAAPAPAAVVQPIAPPLPPGYAAPPPGYAAQGPIPILTMAPPTPVKGRRWLWGVIVVFAILYGLYSIGKHNQQTAPAQPGEAPTQGQAPIQGQPATPSQPGVPSQPGAYPEQQPGIPGETENNAALVRLQLFGGRWDPVNGSILISQGRWTNNANVVVQSATLECVQFAANGSVLTQSQTRLNGPVQPWGTSYFGTFQMGPIVQNLAKVNCGIVSVTPASQ